MHKGSDRRSWLKAAAAATALAAMGLPAGAQAQFRPRLGTFVWTIW